MPVVFESVKIESVKTGGFDFKTIYAAFDHELKFTHHLRQCIAFAVIWS